MPISSCRVMVRAFTPVAATFLMVILLVGGGCSRSSNIDELIRTGDDQLAVGDYTAAEETYMKVLSDLPTEPRAVGRLGILFYHQGRIVQSYAFLEQALKTLTDDGDLRLTFGLASYAIGRTVDARAAARTVLESRPRDETALLLLADTCVTTRDNEEARRIIEDLRKTHGDAPGYAIALGALARAQRDFATAESELKNALQSDPKSGAAYNQLSNLHAARGEQEAAMEALKKAAEFSPVRSAVRIKYITHLVRAGERDKARQQIEAILQEAPDRIPALVQSMQLAFDERRFDDSAATARRILERDRTNLDALMQLAAIDFEAGDFDGAVLELKQAEELYTRAPRIKYQLGLAHWRKGDAYAAEEHLNKALAVSPNYEDAILLLAEIHLRKGAPQSAVTLLERLAAQPPIARRAVVLLAKAYRDNGDVKRGLAVLRALAEKAPANPDNHFLLGLALLTEDPDAARKAFEAAVERAPNHWPAQQMLLDDDLRSGGPAASRADELVAAFPREVAPWMLRAQVRLAAKDLSGAEADLRRVLERDPASSQAHLLLARIFYNQQNPEQAVQTLAASAAQANQPGLYTQLGMLQANLGRHADARAAYEKALAIDPQFTIALNNLAILLSDRFGQPDEALKLARQAKDLAPGDPVVSDTLGWVLHQNRQFASALPLLESSLERLPGDPVVHYHLALTRYALGNDATARDGFEQALANGAEGDVAVDAEERLRVLAIRPADAGQDDRGFLVRRLEKSPEDIGALARLGLIEARNGEVRQAARHLEAVLKVNPRSLDSLVTLAELCAGPLEAPERAMELAKQARALATIDGETSWRLGRLALLLRDYIWAVSVLQDAARGLPQQAEVQLLLSRAYFESGRVKDALEAAQRARAGSLPAAMKTEADRMLRFIEATKDPVKAADVRAEADQVVAKDAASTPAIMAIVADLIRQKDYRGARDRLEEVLTRNPGFTPATRQLVLLYANHLGDDAKAEELASTVRSLHVDDPELALALGGVHYRRADYGMAVRFLQQTLRQDENNPQAFFLLGMAQYHLENGPESRKHLQRALKSGLDPQEASEAERVLQALDGLRRSF